MYCLRIFHPEKSECIPLQESVLTLGRAGENEIVIDDKSIPELALRLTLAENGVQISAAQTRVRPVVNGKRCESALLKPGDRLELGSRAMVLDWLEEKEASPKVPAMRPGMEFGAGLARLCAMVAEERDLKALLGKIMRLLLEATGGNEAFLFTLDQAGKPQVMVSSRGGKSAGSGAGSVGTGEEAERLFSDTIVTGVLRSGKGVFIENALSNPAYAHSKSISDLKLQSVLCCPILAGGTLSGLIYLGSNIPSVSFGERQLRELEVYALVAGCLINHVGYIALQNLMLASLRTQNAEGGEGIVAMSPPMLKVMEEVKAVAAGDIAVLLLGETGTGKDVAANLIHRKSRRHGKPFLVLNCSTLRGELLASELFGHRKGAFTGALQDQQGVFVAADGGTLFLDEIGEMDLPLQAMLLRTLETGRVRPVGMTTEVAADVRILCATNRNLDDMVAKGTFRQDLYYRINQHSILLPPLRERGDDILILAHHFLEKAKAVYPDKKIEGFHPESLFAISRYSWPGNVRELANAVHKAALFATTPAVKISFPESREQWVNMEEATRRFQQDYIQKALGLCGGDKEKAAAMLGMGRSTFFRYLAQAKDQ